MLAELRRQAAGESLDLFVRPAARRDRTHARTGRRTLSTSFASTPPARAAEIARHIGVSSRQTRTYLKRLEQAQRVQGSEGPIQHPDRTYRLFPGV
jgi:predicted ArsR family transcriptional regulator